MESFILFLIYLVIAALIAQLGKKRKIGFGWSFFFCLFLSPIIGLFITLASKKKEVEFVDVNTKNYQQ